MPNASAGNSAHSRHAGVGAPYCSIPPRTAPAQRVPTRCLPRGTVSIPNSRSHPHCPSTSSAIGPANWGSRWHRPTQNRATLRKAEELETGSHTAPSRRSLTPRNVSQPAASPTAGLAFQTRAQTHTAHLLPLLPAPRPGEVDGTTQRKIQKFCAKPRSWRRAAIQLDPVAHCPRAKYPNQMPAIPQG